MRNSFVPTLLLFVVSFITLGVSAQTTGTRGVTEYLEKEFGLHYTQGEDTLKCIENVSTPKTRLKEVDEKKAFFSNCQVVKDNLALTIGWKRKEIERTRFQIFFAINAAKDNGILFQASDRYTCDVETPALSKETLVSCAITFGVSKKVLRYYIYYLNLDNTDADIFVVVTDGFGGQKEKARQLLADYQSHIRVNR